MRLPELNQSLLLEFGPVRAARFVALPIVCLEVGRSKRSESGSAQVLVQPIQHFFDDYEPYLWNSHRMA